MAECVEGCGNPAAPRSRNGRCRSCAARLWGPRWGESELAILREFYPSEGGRVAERLPGRSVAVIRGMARRQDLRSNAPRPAPANKGNKGKRKPKPIQTQDDYRERTAIAFSAAKRSIYARARKMVEDGVPVTNGLPISLKLAMNQAAEGIEREKRDSNAVERAKLKLQRRWPVYSMAIHGGPAHLFVVGNRKNVTEQDLLALAERMAA